MSIVKLKRQQLLRMFTEIVGQLNVATEELKKSHQTYYGNLLIETLILFTKNMEQTIEHFRVNTPANLFGDVNNTLTVLKNGAIHKSSMTEVQNVIVEFFIEKFQELSQEISRYDDILLRNLFDDYHIVKKLGSGSFGTVYEAINSQGVKFAIKVIVNPSRHSIDEIKIMEHFSKTCAPDTPLVCLVESKIVGNHLFVVMEYLENFVPLSDFIDNIVPRQYSPDKGENWETLNEICNNVCEAVKFLHSYKIAHNDLKSENIMIHRESFKIKIIDYGESCYDSECNVNHGFTFLYLDPLIYKNFPHNRSIHRKILHIFKSSIDLYKSEQGDLWSLGCIIYEMFTGRTPCEYFQSKSKATHMDEYFAKYSYKKDVNRPALEDVFKTLNGRSYDLNILLSRGRRFLK